MRTEERDGEKRRQKEIKDINKHEEEKEDQGISGTKNIATTGENGQEETKRMEEEDGGKELQKDIKDLNKHDEEMEDTGTSGIKNQARTGA
ncbi:Uncharacterized protein DAT39_003999, partial [Clarias magur]